MKRKILFLFDVDGTLTKSRQVISNEVQTFLQDLQKRVAVGVVGGSDLKKIVEQMGCDVVSTYDYVFSENGLVAHKNGQLIGKESILNHMGEEKLQMFINYCLLYMSGIALPAKRGNFIEFRSGLINVSPIGRGCSQEERDSFEIYDKEHKVREKFVLALKEKFPDLGLVYSIGGQISFDCFPVGWDKTFCLRHVEKDNFEAIHFFGDKAFEGGNDYELYMDPRTIGHKVKNPDDTVKQVSELIKM